MDCFFNHSAIGCFALYNFAIKPLFIEKKEKYSTSAYNGVKEFLQVYESVSIWDQDRIFARAKKLATLMYYNNLVLD